jgi:hypothetical protein
LWFCLGGSCPDSHSGGAIGFGIGGGDLIVLGRSSSTCLETKSFSRGEHSVLFPRIDADSSIALFPWFDID